MTENNISLQALASDINAGKYQSLSNCKAATNTSQSELFVQNKEGITACVPMAFVASHDTSDVISELQQQLGAWEDLNALWCTEPANNLIH